MAGVLEQNEYFRNVVVPAALRLAREGWFDRFFPTAEDWSKVFGPCPAAPGEKSLDSHEAVAAMKAKA